MTISRGIYRLCVAAMWTTVGVCVTGVVMTRAEDENWLGLLTVGLITAIPAQLFAAAVRLKTLGGRYEDVAGLIHIIGGPMLFVQLLFADQPKSDYGVGSQNAGQTSEESKRTRTERITGTRSRSGSSSRPSNTDLFKYSARSATEKTQTKRPAAAEWTKAASDQISKR